MTSPDVKKLIQALDDCVPVQDSSLTSIDDVRFCRWPSQSADGKKHNSGATPAFPFDGASDGQPLLADGIINERASLLVTAFWRSAVKAKSADDEEGQFAVRLVDYYLNQALFGRLFQEVALSANHLEHYGTVVLNTCWERKVALRRVKVTLQQLDGLAQQMHQSQPQFRLNELATFIADPEQEENAVAVLEHIYDTLAKQEVGTEFDVPIPPIKKGTLRKVIASLRQTNSADVPVPYVCRNEPAVYALKIWDEVWIPNGTTDLRDARFICHREWMTEADLRSKVTEGWNAKWVEEAIKTKGKAMIATELATGKGGNLNAAMNAASTGSVDDTGDLIEVLHVTYKAVDEDGVIGVYQTTLSKHVPQPSGSHEDGLYAITEAISYSHGEYPYVGGKAEHWCRRFLSARGVPETVRTWQQQVKALDDAIIDFTSIGVMPPVNIPKSPLGTKYRFGPAVQNDVLPGREPSFMQVPTSGVPFALSARAAIEARVNNHFALMSVDVPPARWQQSQAVKATFFLLMWSEALQQMVALAQKYMPDGEFARVTGAPLGWLEARRDRIGVMAVTLSFDVRELDSELTLERIKAVNQMVLPADVTGVINRPKWIEMMLRAVNPAWVRDLVMPAADASEQIWNQVRDDIAQMSLGNEARYVENDPTAPTKLQYADQIVRANPEYQAKLQQGGRFSELMQKYAANLQFSAQQQQNKQIGRIGVQPEGQQ